MMMTSSLSKKSASSHSAPLQLNNNNNLKRVFTYSLFYYQKTGGITPECYHKFYQIHQSIPNTRFVSLHSRADPVQYYVTYTHHHVQVRRILVAIMRITTRMSRQQQYCKTCRIQTRSSSLNTTAIIARQMNAVTSRIICAHKPVHLIIK